MMSRPRQTEPSSSVRATAQVAAFLALLDRQGNLAGTDDLAQLESLAYPDSPDPHQLSASQLSHLPAIRAHLDPQDPMDHLDPAVHPDLQDLLATAANPVDQVTEGLKDPQDLVATQEDEDPQDLLVNLHSPLPTPLETKDHLALQAHKAMVVAVEMMGSQAALVALDHKDRKDLPDLKEIQDQAVDLESQDHPDRKETAVSVLSTVLWMVAFSSKMALGGSPEVQ